MRCIFNKLSVLLGLLIMGHTLSAQLIQVTPAENKGTAPSLWQPGLFFRAQNTKGISSFLNSSHPYNTLRTHAVNRKLLQSDSLSHFLTLLDDLKTPFQDYYAPYTNRFVVTISFMPEWLSRSSDTSRLSSRFRVLNGHPPADSMQWDSLITGLTKKLKGWGLHPYYEFWYEPDTFRWQSSLDSFVQLYKQTALAIKQTDSQARVGGPAVRHWPNGLDCDPYQIKGHRPDSLLNDCSLVKKLIDSVARYNIPLDFISWHLWSRRSEELIMAARYFDQQLRAVNRDSSVEMVLTDWNVPRRYRETKRQPPLFIDMLQTMEHIDTLLDGYTVRAWQDPYHHDSLEFYQGKGLITDGGLQKPAWKSLELMNKLQQGRLTEIRSRHRVLRSASLQSDTLFVLVSNKILDPFETAYDHLLYQHSLNELTLEKAGYTSDTIVDSVFRELKEPFGPDTLQDAFQSAIDIYNWADSLQYKNRFFQLQVVDNTNLQGYQYRLDSTHNNQMYRYDSLRKEQNYNRAQAINLLYNNQELVRNSIQMNNALYSFTLPPNASILLQFHNTKTGLNGIAQPSPSFQLYPNPAQQQVTLNYNLSQSSTVMIRLYDLEGRQITHLRKKKLPRGSHTTSLSLRSLSLKEGLYIVQLVTGDQSYYRKLYYKPEKAE